jgi:hypothetical protein
MAGSRITTIGRILRKAWYWLWRLIESRFYRGKEYTVQVPTGHRVLTPWFNENGGSQFAVALRTARSGGDFALPPDRAYVLHHFIQEAARLDGSMAECGVHQGGSAQFIAASLPRTIDLHLFDTFEGMPDIAVPERDYHKPGDYADTSVEDVKQRLRDYLHFCKLHPGVIPDTFSEVADVRPYSLVNVDVDLYPTTLACCEWFWPRISAGGVVIFNDYGFYPYRRSTRRAVDEFFADQQDQPLVLPTGQAVVMKRS